MISDGCKLSRLAEILLNGSLKQNKTINNLNLKSVTSKNV